MILHRKLRQEANSKIFDHQPQKHVLRAVDDVELELVASVLMTASRNIEESRLILPPNQISTLVPAHDWRCRPKCIL